jgi:hypothetical protein
MPLDGAPRLGTVQERLASLRLDKGKVKPPIHVRCIGSDGEVVAKFKMDLNGRGAFVMSECEHPHGVYVPRVKVLMTDAEGARIEEWLNL